MTTMNNFVMWYANVVNLQFTLSQLTSLLLCTSSDGEVDCLGAARCVRFVRRILSVRGSGYLSP